MHLAHLALFVVIGGVSCNSKVDRYLSTWMYPGNRFYTFNDSACNGEVAQIVPFASSDCKGTFPAGTKAIKIHSSYPREFHWQIGTFGIFTANVTTVFLSSTEEYSTEERMIRGLITTCQVIDESKERSWRHYWPEDYYHVPSSPSV